MRYNTKEELENTNEWFLRINEAGFSEELLYVPSQLSKLGLAPIDVVDRLEWLKENGPDTVDHAIVEVETESTVEEPEPPTVGVVDLEVGFGPLDFVYDSYGAWEWAKPVERLIEESFMAMFDLEPGLPDFNGLAILTRSRKRARGKRARASRVPINGPKKVSE